MSEYILDIIAVGLGIFIFIYSIDLFRRTYNSSMVRSLNLYWLTLVIFIFFFLVGYVTFEYFLLTGSELFDHISIISQVFFWGSLFVLICARLFYLTTIGKNELLENNRKMLEELKKSDEKYRSLVESTDDSIYMVDRNCNYLFMNPKHLTRLGIKNYNGSRYGDYHSQEETLSFMQNVSIVFESGKPLRFEHETNGNWYQQKLSPVKDPETGTVKAVGVIVISTDITARKKAEEICLENKFLASVSKTKSEFLANMSHELRTPLNSIIGFSELLKQKSHGELNQKQQHYIDNVIDSSNFLLALINDILDLSKVEAGKIELAIEKSFIPGVINETLSLIKEKALKHNVVLNKELNPELPPVDIDPQRFKQILFNLLSNAVKFSKPEGGTVTVTAKKEGDFARFSVSDTGIGIKEENMRKLFKEFEQLDAGTSRKYGGTGLGLAISKKLVELHGGKIWAESKYGEGTTFIFTLPMNQEKQSAGVN